MINSENNLKASIVLPCRNEEKALADCLRQAKEVLEKYNIKSEIIVSDSSIDNSPEIAKKFGVKLIKHDQIGYGRAYLEGFKAAQGKYIFMADPDGTYDFNEIPKFLRYLDEGYDFVIGNRFKGKIEPGAMTWLRHYIGNPVLSAIFRLFFQTKVSDIHCGMRAITKTALDKLNLRTTGMEFASEMIIRAIQSELKIKELSINYYKRLGKSKLRSFTDGWRHLRFMLSYAPDYLFLIPGILFFLVGLILVSLLKSNVVYGCFFIILGYQVVSLGVYTKVYMKSIGAIKSDRLVDFLARIIRFETGIILGAILLLITFLVGQRSIFNFVKQSLNFPSHSIIIIALTVAIIGIQTMFSAFLISILLVERK
jgi:glycosyltransferase involved in cell wall biosynthesis